jgi:hypothetical protein
LDDRQQPQERHQPALAAGLNAVFLFHKDTWVLEHATLDAAPEGQQLIELDAFAKACVRSCVCLWIRTLDPDARCIFWCDAYVIVELACAATTIRQTTSALHEWFTDILAFLSAVLGIATIYLIRADLLKHYNEREPFGLELGPTKTFFFSFLYFQSQLYDIAQFKKRQAEGVVSNSDRTLLQ